MQSQSVTQCLALGWYSTQVACRQAAVRCIHLDSCGTDVGILQPLQPYVIVQRHDWWCQLMVPGVQCLGLIREEKVDQLPTQTSCLASCSIQQKDEVGGVDVQPSWPEWKATSAEAPPRKQPIQSPQLVCP